MLNKLSFPHFSWMRVFFSTTFYEKDQYLNDLFNLLKSVLQMVGS